MSSDRSKAAQIARETLDAVAAGHYVHPAGQLVPVADLVGTARRGTIDYPPGASLPKASPAARQTRFEVRNETTLVAARRLAGEGHAVAALNFASARKPGGGFINGAIAQEESLARSSALYECIRESPMYGAAPPGGFYTDYAIYSPAVPVFRTDEGGWLDAPYPCAFITCAAVNAGALGGHESEAQIRPVMAARIDKVLAVAAAHRHPAVVLGAWGCGVFRNDPDLIAELFARSLRGRFAGAFEAVTFAVLDGSAAGATIGPFEARFGSAG